MKRVIFAGLLLIIIFSLSLSCYAFEGSFTPQYKPLARGNHLMHAHKEVDIGSFQRHGGKGTYAGEDTLRPRGKGHRSGAASFFILKSSSFISTLLLLRYVIVFVFIYVVLV
ncbi:hypothetical protein P3X46_031744 [Hevea brasiliensis]|uniref:Uncharacterized protein n=1 Tax=Hevea brasiliensis TaxID=3981 RepID=A0ABQ9KML3_HEVBR|nr:hypothetical protein P3X46_031744 [Hevea brasiliensis]